MNMDDYGALGYEWICSTFGDAIATHSKERALRLLEEALELYQSLDGDVQMAHNLTNTVFQRPVGDPTQELAQVGLMVTTLAHQLSESVPNLVRAEMFRVMRLNPEKPKARMLEKFKAGLTHCSDDDIAGMDRARR